MEFVYEFDNLNRQLELLRFGIFSFPYSICTFSIFF